MTLRVLAGATITAGLTACGDSSAPRSPAAPAPAEQTSSPADAPVQDQYSILNPRPRPKDPSPTRLIGPPLLFRVTGTRAPTEHDLSPQLRYVVFFRLNRGSDAAVQRGQYSGSFFILDEDGPLHVTTFGRRRLHCFSGEIYGKGSDDPSIARRLDALAVGSRVKVHLQPLTPTAAGKRKLIDKPYIPRLRLRVSGSKDAGGLYELTSPEYRRLVRQIGCL